MLDSPSQTKEGTGQQEGEGPRQDLMILDPWIRIHPFSSYHFQTLASPLIFSKPCPSLFPTPFPHPLPNLSRKLQPMALGGCTTVQLIQYSFSAAGSQKLFLKIPSKEIKAPEVTFHPFYPHHTQTRTYICIHTVTCVHIHACLRAFCWAVQLLPPYLGPSSFSPLGLCPLYWPGRGAIVWA